MSKNPSSLPFEQIESSIPFHKLLGFKVDKFEKGRVTLFLPFRAEFIGNFVSGVYHGGVLSGILDAVAGITAISQVYPDVAMDKLATMDMRVDYLKPVKGQDIYIHGKVSSAGKRAIFVNMWITYPDDDKVLVEGKAVMNVRV